MTTRANIEAAIYDWVSQATGATTIFANQSMPRPETPYLTIRITTLIPIGGDEERSFTDPGEPDYATLTYRGDREVTVSVQSFGAGALDLARAAARTIATDSRMSSFAAAGLFPRGEAPTVNELTELLETDFEERAQFDAVFGFAEEYSDAIPVIEHVDGEGTFQQPPNPDRLVPFEASKP